MRYLRITVLILLLGPSGGLRADCPLDHLVIGCNEDGIAGTEDDHKLFVDRQYKYRHSGELEYENWYYPLAESIVGGDWPWRIGEPGFDLLEDGHTHDEDEHEAEHGLVGEPEQDYRIIVECVALSPGLRAQHKEYPQFTLDEAGDSFDHSAIHAMRGDPHMHMSYQAVDGQQLKWITFRLHDELADGGQYESSEPFTIVFNVEPPAGDLVVDGQVGVDDLAELSYYWLAEGGSRHNDYFERADANRDGRVDFADFGLLALNWLRTPEQP